MADGLVTGGAVRNADPQPNDYGAIVRVVGVAATNEPIIQTRFDIGETVIYTGYAALGVAAAAAGWRIKRTTFVGGNPTVVQWTGTAFDTTWNDRAAAAYS